MKTLKDYSEDIYKCTKCGSCQAICPIYQETGLETAVSRGKFTLLHGILTGKVEFSKKIGKYLDMCLGCRACFDYCPSGIYADEIIEAARAEYARLHGVKPLKKILIYLLNSNIMRLLRRRIAPPCNDKSVVYFPGCMETSTNAVKLVLEKNGFEVHIPKGFKCCGMAAKNSGDLDTFSKLAEHNIKQVPEDAEFILTECASCGSAWQSYGYKNVINIYKFLDDINLHIPKNASFNHTVTWHDPCHLIRYQGISKEPRSILKKVSGLIYKEMEEAGKCCGAAGTFCITKPGISLAISRKKAKNVINSGADIVSTSCSGCKMGITQGLASLGAIKRIMSPVEILASLYSQE